VPSKAILRLSSMRRYALRELKSIACAFLGSSVRPDVWLMDGTEVLSGDHFSLLHVGTAGHKNYIGHLVFNGDFKETHIGRTFSVSAGHVIKRNTFDCSLMIVEVGSLGRKVCEREQDFYVPLFVQGEVDIPLVAHNESARSDIRRIRRNHLDFVVTTQPGQFRAFYYDMYLPYVTQRYHDRLLLMDYDEMMQKARQGDTELLLVRKGTEFIGGAVIAFDRGLPKLWSVGIKDGNLSYWRDGVVAAVYYFSSMCLAERGHKRIHVGSSRAFLSNGVLRYKRKWGMRVVGHWPPIGFLLKPLSLSQGLRGFLLRNPFLCIDKGRLCSAVFAENDEVRSDRSLERLHKHHYLAGISKASIYRFGEGESKTWFIPEECAPRLGSESGLT